MKALLFAYFCLSHQITKTIHTHFQCYPHPFHPANLIWKYVSHKVVRLPENITQCFIDSCQKWLVKTAYELTKVLHTVTQKNSTLFKFWEISWIHSITKTLEAEHLKQNTSFASIKN